MRCRLGLLRIHYCGDIQIHFKLVVVVGKQSLNITNSFEHLLIISQKVPTHYQDINNGFKRKTAFKVSSILCLSQTEPDKMIQILLEYKSCTF